MIPATKIRQLFLIALIILSIILIGSKILPYLSGVLGAITIYVIIHPFYEKLIRKNWKKEIASIFLIVTSTIVILIPVSAIVWLLTNKVSVAISNKEKIQAQISDRVKDIQELVPLDLNGIIDKKEISNFISNAASQVFSDGLTIFIAAGIFYLLLYFMLVNSGKWQEKLQVYLPLKQENLNMIAQESKHIVKANAIGVPIVAILQGLVAVIGFYIFGVDNPWFWFTITAIGSMIPFIGTAIGIVPTCLLLLSQGNTGAAIGLALFGLIAVGATDNLFRLVVQKRIGNIHPLITLFGVIAGIPLFGFLGLIYGPMIVGIILLLFKIYRKEYSNEKDMV